MKKRFAIAALIVLSILTLSAQQKKATATKTASTNQSDSLIIPISKADLGTFPYFTTIPANYEVLRPTTVEFNRTYFFDGKKYFTVDGQVFHQTVTITDRSKQHLSEFACIDQFDKIIANLGGIKIYAGKVPEEQLKSLAGGDLGDIARKSQIVGSAYDGVIEYVIKTPEKEVWVQLEPYSLVSYFYELFVVEKKTALAFVNTNRQNQILEDLQKNKRSMIHISFEPDNANILTESKDEILSLLGVFQAHPDWKLQIECYTAPVGKADYTLALTEKRTNAIKHELISLGVKDAAITAKGMGDQKPLASNETEQGRLSNTRVEISLH